MMQDIESARKALKAALELHAAHMNGTTAVSDSSQRRLMSLIETAYKALGVGAYK